MAVDWRYADWFMAYVEDTDGRVAHMDANAKSGRIRKEAIEAGDSEYIPLTPEVESGS